MIFTTITTAAKAITVSHISPFPMRPSDRSVILSRISISVPEGPGLRPDKSDKVEYDHSARRRKRGENVAQKSAPYRKKDRKVKSTCQRRKYQNDVLPV